jgi:hypothetical protein
MADVDKSLPNVRQTVTVPSDEEMMEIQTDVQEVIEECASFPFGDNDDLVDSTTQAVLRFRQGGFLNHPEDYKESIKELTVKEYY